MCLGNLTSPTGDCMHEVSTQHYKYAWRRNDIFWTNTPSPSLDKPCAFQLSLVLTLPSGVSGLNCNSWQSNGCDWLLAWNAACPCV